MTKESINRISLSTPHLGGLELKYIKDAFHKNMISSKGENVTLFEKNIQDYLKDNKKVVSLNSGTSALHLALILAGVKLNDEVICQSFTFSASANPITYQGAKPIFVDSEVETWNMCPVALEEAILDRISKGKKPKAIIVVDLYGMPAKLDEICTIAKKYDISLIEDAAEVLGSTYKGKKCGTFGDFGIFSFNGNKIITTSGGGALVCKTEEIKQKAIFLATQARDVAPHYQHSKIGYNYRMSNILAGIGRGQMEVLDQHIKLRREMHFFYKELFSKIDNVTIFEEPSTDYYSNHWLSAILLNSYETREALRMHLKKENIESRPLMKPMHLQPVFKNSQYYGNKVAEKLFEKGLCLPSGSNLTKEDRSRIKEQINLFFNVE